VSTSTNIQATRCKEARVAIEVDDLYSDGKITTLEVMVRADQEYSDSVTFFLPGAPHDAVSHMITALQAILEPPDHGGWERANATFTLKGGE
jgi:hypothetical protein